MDVFAFVLEDANIENAQKYLMRKYPEAGHNILAKSSLNGKRLVDIVGEFRKNKFSEACIYSKNLDFQTKKFFLSILLILTGAKKLFFVDMKERNIHISRTGFIFRQIPSFIAECTLSALALCILPIIAFLLRAFTRPAKKIKPEKGRTIFFLRTEFAFEVAGGGSVTHINGIAKGFLKEGYSVVFISNEKMENVDYPTRVIPPSTFFTNLPDIPQIAYNFKFFFSSIRYIREYRPTALYLRHDFYTLSAVLLSKIFRVPLIVENNGVRLWTRSYWDKVYLTPIVRIIEDTVLSLCEEMVVVTKTIKEECTELGVNEDRIVVTPNAVDPDIFYPGAGGEEVRKKFKLKGKIIAYSGSFINFHGMDILQAAIPLILSKTRDVYFILIGDGPMKIDVERFIEKNGWKKHFLLTGCIPIFDVPKYLDASDILIAPYVPLGGTCKFFGSSVKQFEYMAMGKGIVASDIGQVGKLLNHEKSAILVEPGNPQALADGILRLIGDEALCKKIGIQARKDVLSKHTWQKNVQKILRA